MSTSGFYDAFAPNYHLAYGGNWDAAVERQGVALDGLIQAAVPGASAVLDCSCGIGTQAIGLALRGYRVTGTDVSKGEIARARTEAERFGVDVTFAVADFRDLSALPGGFDAVISCDNAVPHLLEPQEVERALGEMRGRLRDGGLLLITMRDFDEALKEKPSMAPPIVVDGPPRTVLVRLHDWDDAEPSYTVRYLVLTEHEGGWEIDEHTTRYRAITREELTRAAHAAGFGDVHWQSDRPVVGGQQVMSAIAERRPTRSLPSPE